MSGSPQTPQSVCGPGELGESLEKHTAGRLLNLKGKDSTGKRGGWSRGHSGSLEDGCEGSRRCTAQGGCDVFQTEIKVFLFKPLHCLGGIRVDKKKKKVFLYAAKAEGVVFFSKKKNKKKASTSTFANLK